MEKAGKEVEGDFQEDWWEFFLFPAFPGAAFCLLA